MKIAVNQATLMKTPMDIFLNSLSSAGFAGVEVRRDQIFTYLENHSVNDLTDLLQENHLECITFNAIELFSLCSEKKFQKMLDYTERLMKIGNVIGCDTIIAVPSFFDDENIISESKIITKTIERLEILSNLAEKYTFKLGFEPLGFPNCSVRKVDLALKIITDEKLPEIGLIIDTFHYFVGEHSVNELSAIPLEKIWLIHINDAMEKPLIALQDSHRVLPCQGFFSLEMFVKKLKAIGYNKWLSLELFNKGLWLEDPFEVSKNAMNSLQKLL